MQCVAVLMITSVFVGVGASTLAAQSTAPAEPTALINGENASAKLKLGNQAQDILQKQPPAQTNAVAPQQTVTRDVEPNLKLLPQSAPGGGYIAAPKPPPAPLTFEQTIAKTVVEELNTKNSSRAGLSDKDVAALNAYYGVPNPTLLWTSKVGLTPAAQSAVTELKRADTYALNPARYKTPSLKSPSPSNEEIASAELKISRAVLRYARHVKAGRVKPGQVGLQLTQTPKAMAPKDVLEQISTARDVSAYLRGLHPTHPQFVALRERLLELTGRASASGPKTKIPNGPVLKKGVTHTNVALLRTRLELETPQVGSETFDDILEAAVKEFQKKSGTTPDGIVGPGTRSALNGKSNPGLVKKIKLNMERWRWLPDNMDGEAGLHVWINIAEFRVRVLKNYQRVFSERAIVGLVTHKTPVFSDMMEWIEIHPTWFVPDSIKVNDILPSLKRPTSTVVKRYNLKLNCGAHGSNPNTIDWSKIDIRKCSFTQPAGPKSVLGDFKFKFPNRHSVYMHDTHKRQLFATTKRTYSHGCVRVQKPRKLAHILLDNDKGMTAKQLDRIVDGPQKLRTEKLNRHVPVHLTYFTAFISDEGNLKTVSDSYGHDARLSGVLFGNATAAQQIAADPKLKKQKQAPQKPENTEEQQAGWWQDLFPAN